MQIWYENVNMIRTIFSCNERNFDVLNEFIMLRDLWEAINISGAVQFWIKSGRGKWIRNSSIDFY